MADQTMTVVAMPLTGILDVAAHASAKAGNAAGSDYFYYPNDGKTILLCAATTGDTFTFTAVACEHGRTETKAIAVAAGKFAVVAGFLDPQLWNQTVNNMVKFKPTTGHADDMLLAVKFV